MSSFNKYPEIVVSEKTELAWEGYGDIVLELEKEVAMNDRTVLVIDCYPGVNMEEILVNLVQPLQPTHALSVDEIYHSNEKVTEMIQYHLTDDRVFGIFSAHEFRDFMNVEKREKARKKIDSISNGLVIVYGVGASLVYQPDILLYADLPRWEIQTRFQHKMPNWKADNEEDDFLRKIKRAYFFEWPVADKHKKRLIEKVDYWLDTTISLQPKMVEKTSYLAGLKQVVSQPFRLVPYFAPGVWGGEWMREKFDLDKDEVNFAWSFNGVPAENSIFLKYGHIKIEIPANNVVFQHPMELLGNKVYGRFGNEFPIRFNFLDTVEGQNLSLQVHPTTDYVQETFGAHYTQDESYYILHAEDDAVVYLGLKENMDKDEMIADLERAEQGITPFNDEKFVNKFPIKKHDHYSIPGGTVHSQGRNSVVLEISSTPNIYTFKLWDWGRVDLDGKPRPVHLKHGINSIQWYRDTSWVKQNLFNPEEKLAEGDGWIEERTGLHETEFIETRRHWFSKKVHHRTHDSVNVFNLVEGEEAIIESPDDEFEPFIVHYAETFIIPECIKEYTIRPYGKSEGKTIATIKAFVRV
ncbi:class I mannose-6-phosphate isomerase [Lederbergia graminis]|uniref:Class I mannose-6-phosphate isomerase n=1 Tax=Lederbergia graminis TaxID=735518 RepID=A0ABW0LJX6_9BACI